MKESFVMSSRSLRRSVAVLAFAASLLPISALNAAQRQSHPAPTSAAQHRNPIVEFFQQFFIDMAMTMDGNG